MGWSWRRWCVRVAVRRSFAVGQVYAFTAGDKDQLCRKDSRLSVAVIAASEHRARLLALSAGRILVCANGKIELGSFIRMLALCPAAVGLSMAIVTLGQQFAGIGVNRSGITAGSSIPVSQELKHSIVGGGGDVLIGGAISSKFKGFAAARAQRAANQAAAAAYSPTDAATGNANPPFAKPFPGAKGRQVRSAEAASNPILLLIALVDAIELTMGVGSPDQGHALVEGSAFLDGLTDALVLVDRADYWDGPASDAYVAQRDTLVDLARRMSELDLQLSDVVEDLAATNLRIRTGLETLNVLLALAYFALSYLSPYNEASMTIVIVGLFALVGMCGSMCLISRNGASRAGELEAFYVAVAKDMPVIDGVASSRALTLAASLPAAGVTTAVAAPLANSGSEQPASIAAHPAQPAAAAEKTAGGNATGVAGSNSSIDLTAPPPSSLRQPNPLLSHQFPQPARPARRVPSKHLGEPSPAPEYQSDSLQPPDLNQIPSESQNTLTIIPAPSSNPMHGRTPSMT